MPGNPRAIVADAERQFPVRIAVRVPPDGIGQRYTAMRDWLDENCGVGGWSIAPAGTHGVLNDAIAVYMNGPTCAVAFRGTVVRSRRSSGLLRAAGRPTGTPYPA